MTREPRHWAFLLDTEAQFFPTDGERLGLFVWSETKDMFRALRHHNYCIFFYGQSISLIGTWMQQVAFGWLVYSMTNSVYLLGVVGFSGQIATFFLAPFAGVIADRYHRHSLLVIIVRHQRLRFLEKHEIDKLLSVCNKTFGPL